MQVFVILPAAGLGTRMAGPQPKQFLSLDGVPILIHSLRAFAAVKRVTAIYVAVRKTEMERVEAQIAEYGFTGRAQVVEGGDKRQESVAHALAALPAEADDIVLVHDAVRPLIDAATIDRINIYEASRLAMKIAGSRRPLATENTRPPSPPRIT